MAEPGDSQDRTTELYKTLAYSVAEFDKAVIFIASGALGISFAFIEKLVDLDSANSLTKLTGAWYCFTSAIMLGLISHFVSILALRWSITNCLSENYPRGMRRWNRPIRVLNILMIALLIFGLWALIGFVQRNLGR